MQNRIFFDNMFVIHLKAGDDLEFLPPGKIGEV